VGQEERQWDRKRQEGESEESESPNVVVTNTSEWSTNIFYRCLYRQHTQYALIDFGPPTSNLRPYQSQFTSDMPERPLYIVSSVNMTKLDIPRIGVVVEVQVSSAPIFAIVEAQNMTVNI